MKTIVIWNSIDSKLQYFVLDGDFSRFDQVFIGLTSKQELQDELSNMLWTEEGDNKEEIKFLDKFPIEEIYKNEPDSVIVIEAGFIP